MPDTSKGNSVSNKKTKSKAATSTKTPNEKSKSSEEKKKSIREAAYHAFRSSGYYKTSVDDICKRASISKGSFYWHYPTKQEVFIDIIQTWAREVITEMLIQFEVAVKQDDYPHTITTALQKEIRRGRAIIPLWLEFTSHGQRDPAIKEAIAAFYRRARTAVAELLREPLQSEIFSTDVELKGVAVTPRIKHLSKNLNNFLKEL